jgi:predicted transcriptional regulator
LGTFNAFFKKIAGDKKEYDFEGIASLRKLLSNERARILSAIKTKKPDSIYQLAKLLNRDFKSVNDDLKLLDRFGFIDLISTKENNRLKLKPVLIADTVIVKINI